MQSDDPFLRLYSIFDCFGYFAGLQLSAFRVMSEYSLVSSLFSGHVVLICTILEFGDHSGTFGRFALVFYNIFIELM